MTASAVTFRFSQFQKNINDSLNVNFDDIVSYINNLNDGTNFWDQLRVTGSAVVGAAALLTTATDGFLYIPTCPGVPTGIPTTFTGTAPLVVDSTDNRLYFYSSGAWRNAGP